MCRPYVELQDAMWVCNSLSDFRLWTLRAAKSLPVVSIVPVEGGITKCLGDMCFMTLVITALSFATAVVRTVLSVAEMSYVR